MWTWLPDRPTALPLSKRAYQARASELRRVLLSLQTRAREAPFSTVVLVAGVDGAGKGETVNLLNGWLDPRWIRTRSFDRPSDEERERPALWRFWRALPAHGHTALFLSAWYSEPLLQRVHGAEPDQLDGDLERIRGLERTLADGGNLIVKLWLHLGRDAQERRLRALQDDPLQSWRVTERDWEHLALYDRFAAAAEAIFDETHTPQSPWHVVDGSDPRRRSIEVGEILERALRGRLQQEGAEVPAPAPLPQATDERDSRPGPEGPSGISKDDYRRELAKLQGELNLLHRRARERGVPLVAVFEGRDAAGKGGAIRRVVPAFDARCVHVVRVGPPTQEEREHHYLWRFWRNLPRAGCVTLFDRSWYGRVLVERVEGLASEAEWSRAYGEIADFERQLLEHGTALVKIWLDVDKKEQARRFEERLRVAHKRWKLSDEDWRNRKEWKAYTVAVREMLERSDTEHAPWHVVPANEKRSTRLEVLRTLCRTLEARLAPDSAAAEAVGRR